MLTLWSNLKPDGFSLYYQHAAGLAGVFYLVAGLAVLRKFLRRHFSAGITLAALVSITWGTNLFHYGTYDSVYSHVYSFFLFCSFLALTASWYDRPSLGGSLLLGLFAGLIFLTRHENALFLVCFPFYGVFDRQTLAARLRLFAACIPHLAAMAAAAILVATPQFLMYRAATGSFLADPYANLMTKAGTEAFRFGNPQLLGVLFSAKKGVFFWSPILALSVAGFFVLRGTARSILLPSLIYLPVTVYLAASWWDWQLGGSYGHRALTEGSALLVVPIAALYQSVSGRPHVRTVVAVFAATAILLSVLQMVQYWLGIIPFSDVSWPAYRASFLRFTR
jgi:hypothetical protein